MSHAGTAWWIVNVDYELDGLRGRDVYEVIASNADQAKACA